MIVCYLSQSQSASHVLMFCDPLQIKLGQMPCLEILEILVPHLRTDQQGLLGGLTFTKAQCSDKIHYDWNIKMAGICFDLVGELLKICVGVLLTG